MSQRPATWEGRAPSPVWRQAVTALRPYGLTPASYIMQMRAEGCSWREVGELLAKECGLERPTGAGTLQFWLQGEPYWEHHLRSKKAS